MAVFLLKAKYGKSYTPPAAQGIFSDVSKTRFDAPWIEALYREGITSGCSTTSMKYCPNSSVTRSDMAIFLSKVFNLK
jgi:hypothetical protein